MIGEKDLSFGPAWQAIVERIVTSVKDGVLSQTVPAANVGLATAMGCVLRAASLLDRVVTLAAASNPEGVGLLIRCAFETSVQGLWMLAAPQNVVLLYTDYQRSSRFLLEGAKDRGEIDTHVFAAAVAAVDSNLPDRRLPSFDVILADVHRWATDQRIVELEGLDQMYNRLYRPLSLFDVHGFGPVHRYMVVPGVDEGISFLAVPDPFVAPDEIALAFAGLLAEMSIAVFREAGIDCQPLKSILPDAAGLAKDRYRYRSTELADLVNLDRRE